MSPQTLIFSSYSSWKQNKEISQQEFKDRKRFYCYKIRWNKSFEIHKIVDFAQSSSAEGL